MTSKMLFKTLKITICQYIKSKCIVIDELQGHAVKFSNECLLLSNGQQMTKQTFR